jgi:hypothetical protein
VTKRETSSGRKKRASAGRKKRASAKGKRTSTGNANPPQAGEQQSLDAGEGTARAEASDEQADAGRPDSSAGTAGKTELADDPPEPSAWPESMPEADDPDSSDETRAVIALAGIEDTFARRRRSALALIGIGVILIATIVLDLVGIIEIPGVDLRNRIGIAPRPEVPAVKNGRTKALSPAARRRMRRDLLGGGKPPSPTRPKKRHGLSAAERRVAADIFASDEKRDVRLQTPKGVGIRAPNLPDGLSAKAVTDVIAENSSSAALCLAESMRRSTVPPGRMEIEITILPSGRVSDARTSTGRYAGTQFASCVTRRIHNWRFPSFAGDPVTVVYPYIVSSEM